MKFHRAFYETHALRPAYFMSGTDHIIAATQPGRREFSHPLRGVAKKRHRPCAAQRQRLPPRLQDAGFIVRRHDRDQPRTPLFQLLSEPFEIHHAFTRHRDQAVRLGKIALCCCAHTRMLDGRKPHFFRARTHRVMQHRIARLRRATRPHDLRRVALQPARQPLPRFRQRRVRPRSESVRTGGIPDKPLHCLHPCRTGGGGNRI